MKKGWFSKVIVTLCIVSILWFTNRILDIFEASQQEPAVIIGAVFAFFGTELIGLITIKKDKKKKEKEND